MSLHTGCLLWQILMQKLAILTRACRLIVVGLLFVFVVHGAGVRRATCIYLCLNYAKNVDKNWDITISFIIHVTLRRKAITVSNSPVTLFIRHTMTYRSFHRIDDLYFGTTIYTSLACSHRSRLIELCWVAGLCPLNTIFRAGGRFC